MISTQVTCGPTAAPTAKPTGAPGICSDETEYSHLVGKPCKSVWTTDDTGCEAPQYGCPDSACDDDDKPWCVIDGGEYVYNPGWCYCEPTPKPSGKCIITDESDDHSTKGAITGASCLAVWTSDDSAACEVDQYGCPDSACDATSDDDRPWCMYDEDNWCYCE